MNVIMVCSSFMTPSCSPARPCVLDKGDRPTGVRSPTRDAAESIEPSILRPGLVPAHFDYRSDTPAPAPLDELIAHFWTVTWDAAPGESYTAQTLPYPSVNLSVTNTEADVTGLTRAALRPAPDRVAGTRSGARFRPACFRPLIDGPVARLITNRHRPIARCSVASTEDAETSGSHDRDGPAGPGRDARRPSSAQAGRSRMPTALRLADVVEP